MFRRYAAAMIAAALVALAHAQDAQRFEFKGLPIGATQAEILAKFPFLDCREQKDKRGGDVLCMGTERVMKAQDFTFGGVPLKRVSLFLYNDGLEGVQLLFATTDFDSLSRAMTEGYGTPTKAEHETLQSRAGAAYQNDVRTWQRGNVTVELRKYGENIDEGRVGIATQTAVNEFRRRSRDRTGKGANARPDGGGGQWGRIGGVGSRGACGSSTGRSAAECCGRSVTTTCRFAWTQPPA